MINSIILARLSTTRNDHNTIVKNIENILPLKDAGDKFQDTEAVKTSLIAK